jgi:hypothetical protein
VVALLPLLLTALIACAIKIASFIKMKVAMSDNEATGEGEPGKFHVSFPGPGLQPGKNVTFWAAEGDSAGGREFEDIMLRRVPAAAAHRFRGAAGARGFTHAQYLTALIALHEAMRGRADDGDAEVAAVLEQLGLGTVSI